MHRTYWLTACGLACLAIIPNSISSAASLREEAVTYRTQAYLAQQQGDLAGAFSLYQKAASLDPSYPTPHNDLGVLLEEEGRLDEAEREYQQALALNPKYLEAHANLAMLYERMGEIEKAGYHWMRRYQLSDASDPGTNRAEDRLIALGFLKYHPEFKGRIYTRRHLLSQELEAHAQSKKEFRAVTDQHGEWP